MAFVRLAFFKKISILILFPEIVLAYDIICPDRSQRQLRDKGFCVMKNNNESVYTCLENLNTHKFDESCSETEEAVKPGERYVIRGASRNDKCSTDRYQPFKFYKTSGPMCVFLKSKCSEFGQVVARNGSGLNDKTCICDYTQGYAYVTRPADVCNCVPSEEDCTCFKKDCPENRRLSAEHECIHKSVTSTTECTSMAKIDPTLTITTPDFTETKINLSALSKSGLIAVLLSITCAGVVMILTKKYKSYNEARKMSCRVLSDEFYIRLIGHWRTLKSAIDLNGIFPILVKNDVISELDVNVQKKKSPSDQQDFVLYSLLRLSDNKCSITKRIQILRKQGTLVKILKGPIRKPLWHSRSIECSKRQLDNNRTLLEGRLNPVYITDDFLQSFIFELKQYEEIMKYTITSKMAKAFLDHLLVTLNRGSFECLLTQLEKYECFSDLCQVLTDDLVQASLTRGRVSEVKDFIKGDQVCLSVKTQTPDDGWVGTVRSTCFEWLIEKFAIYPSDKLSTTSDVLLISMVDDAKGRLIKGIRNGALTRFIEIIFDMNKFRNLTNNKNLTAEVSITIIKVDRNNIPAAVSYQEKRCVQNIVTLNKKFMEEDFDHVLFSRALSEKGDNSFMKNMDGSSENGSDKKQWFFQKLETKMDKKFFSIFLKILEENNICSHKIKKRLLVSRKVLAAEAPYLQDKLMENFSALVPLVTVMEDFKEICSKRDIFTSEHFATIEQKWGKGRQWTGILVETIKSKHRDAMLALVESLFINEQDFLASDILYVNPGEIEQGHSDEITDELITEENCGENGLLFVGEYEICKAVSKQILKA